MSSFVGGRRVPFLATDDASLVAGQEIGIDSGLTTSIPATPDMGAPTG